MVVGRKDRGVAKGAMPVEVTLELRSTGKQSPSWSTLWRLLLAPPRDHPPGRPENDAPVRQPKESPGPNPGGIDALIEPVLMEDRTWIGREEGQRTSDEIEHSTINCTGSLWTDGT